MPSAESLRIRLLKKLQELFQLDQPDLDFGFYRIMHAKAQQVQTFIEGLIKYFYSCFAMKTPLTLNLSPSRGERLYDFSHDFPPRPLRERGRGEGFAWFTTVKIKPSYLISPVAGCDPARCRLLLTFKKKSTKLPLL